MSGGSECSHTLEKPMASSCAVFQTWKYIKMIRLCFSELGLKRTSSVKPKRTAGLGHCHILSLNPFSQDRPRPPALGFFEGEISLLHLLILGTLHINSRPEELWFGDSFRSEISFGLNFSPNFFCSSSFLSPLPTTLGSKSPSGKPLG